MRNLHQSLVEIQQIRNLQSQMAIILTLFSFPSIAVFQSQMFKTGQLPSMYMNSEAPGYLPI